MNSKYEDVMKMNDKDELAKEVIELYKYNTMRDFVREKQLERLNWSKPVSISNEQIDYNQETRVLSVGDKSHDFSSSRISQGLLAILFKDRDDMFIYRRSIYRFKKHQKEFQRYDIRNSYQLNTAKRYIQNQIGISDLFVKGYLTIANKYK